MKKALVVGQLCEDVLLFNPASVEVLGHKVWAEDVVSVTGGSAAYSSEALLHLGMEVSLASVVGDDLTGANIHKDLLSNRIDCEYVRVLPGRKTARSVIVCDKGGKDFIGCSPMLPMHLPDIGPERYDMAYVAGYMLYPELWTDETYSFLKRLKEKGVFVALDCQLLPNPDVDPIRMGRLDRIFPLADVFLAARKEVAQLFGEIAPEEAGKRLLGMGCGTVVLKQGESGCAAMAGSEVHYEPRHDAEVYNSVGSGDIFGAAFGLKRLNGHGLAESARFASVFTALSLGRHEDGRVYPDINGINDVRLK